MTYLNEMKVLYIEDDTETREALQRFLKRRCGKVIAAKDAETGLEIFDTYEPDIIIVDLLLPGMNGMDFIDKIHKISPEDDIRILITTTVSEVDTVINSIDKNISAYVLKPFDINDLEEKLEQIASKIYDSSVNKSRRSVYVNEDNKGVISDGIRVDFLKLLKSKSGKGPTKVNVILNSDSIEIIAHDTLTAYEKTITGHGENVVLIEQVREVFYKSLKSILENILKEKSGINFIMDKVIIDVRRRVDHIIFTVN